MKNEPEDWCLDDWYIELAKMRKQRENREVHLLIFKILCVLFVYGVLLKIYG